MENQILLYNSENGKVNITVTYYNETFWLAQKNMAALFGVEVPAISKHLKNIFETGELNETSVISKMETTAADGKKYLTSLSYEQQKITEELKVVEKVVEKITENQLKILRLIAENPTVSALDIAQKIGISHRKTQENIKKLKESGVIKRIGPAKGGHWQVINPRND